MTLHYDRDKDQLTIELTEADLQHLQMNRLLVQQVGMVLEVKVADGPTRDDARRR